MGSASLDTMSFDDSSAGSGHSRRAGIAALCGLFLGTYLLLASPLHNLVPSSNSLGFFVPAVIGIGFLVAGRLFGMVLASAGSRRRMVVVRASVVATLLLAVALCAALRMKALWWASNGNAVAKTDARFLPAALLDTAASATRVVHPAVHGRPWLEIACMVTIEESIKLLPVFFLIRRRAVRTAGEAMWAGALGGLCFGMIEAVNHSFFLYARMGSPVTTYLVRALVMAPSHGVGAAIACGVVFGSARQRRRGGEGSPSPVDMLAGFLVAVAMHATHNGLQAVCGPSVQIATVFLPIVLLYGLSPRTEWPESVITAARPAGRA